MTTSWESEYDKISLIVYRLVYLAAPASRLKEFKHLNAAELATVLWRVINNKKLCIYNAEIYTYFRPGQFEIDFAETAFKRNGVYYNLKSIFYSINDRCRITPDNYRRNSITIYNHLDKIFPESILKYKYESVINFFEYGRHEKKCAKLREIFCQYLKLYYFLIGNLPYLINHDVAGVILEYIT